MSLLSDKYLTFLFNIIIFENQQSRRFLVDNFLKYI